MGEAFIVRQLLGRENGQLLTDGGSFSSGYGGLVGNTLTISNLSFTPIWVSIYTLASAGFDLGPAWWDYTWEDYRVNAGDNSVGGVYRFEWSNEYTDTPRTVGYGASANSGITLLENGFTSDIVLGEDTGGAYGFTSGSWVVLGFGG